MFILDGKIVATQKYKEIETRVAQLKQKKIKPGLAIMQVGDDPSSSLYVQLKEKRARKLGFNLKIKKLAEKTDYLVASEALNKLANDRDIHGLIVQLPLPQWPKQQQIALVNQISEIKDVDLLSQKARQSLVKGTAYYYPPAPAAIINLLQNYQVNLNKEKILLIGNGTLVGQPLSHILKHQGCQFIIADQKTTNLDTLFKQSTLIISATGVPGLLDLKKINPDSIVIDAGTAEKSGKVLGDVNPEGAEKLRAFAPVPGGVGPLTVAMLLENTLLACERQNQ